MKICSIIAEYNLFHNGHLHHLTETRAQLGANTAIVCAMSGNFVQRGDLAVMEKYQRAEAAVRCGADLVIELPLTACLSSADGFAAGGISLLHALGCITHLSFGSECGQIDQISHAARLQSMPQTQQALQEALQAGLSYAAAMQQAISLHGAQTSALYANPNNTLGIAYCAALGRMNSNIVPLTITRRGAAHDVQHAPEGLPSASYLRSLLAQNNAAACLPFMPPASYAVLKDALSAGTAPTFAGAVDQALLAHLRRLSPVQLAHYAGGNDGLHHRLWAAVQENTNFTAICAAAQTRRYPLARIRRALLRAWLELPTSLSCNAQYVRVLALGPKGREILRRMKESCQLPVILKPSTERRLSPALYPALAQDCLADDLYALAAPSSHLHIGGNRFRKTPFVLP